jgi:glycosyltransferase involved in cell wall biosynthesis
MIGILTTYNQTCGLAKYAEQLFGHIERSDYLILAEQVPATSLLSSDQPNTIRCWKKFDTSYLELEKVIFDRGIKLLHLNCQHSFFKAQVFCETLKRLRSNGVKVILHVHAPDTHCENLKRLISSVDHFIVNTPENKSEMILSGAPSEEITVLEMGVPVFANLSKAEAREKLGLAQTARVIATPGFVRTHKGVAEVLPEIAALNKMGFPIEYHLLGASHPDDQDQKYINDLDQQAINLGIKDLVHFQNTFATDKDLELGLLASDAVVLNYQSKNYESSMAISLAFAAGKPILTSTAPTFARFAGSVFHCTPGFPLRVALYNVFNNKQFADHLSNAAKLWAVNNSWTNVAADLSATYDRLLKQQTKQVNIVRQAENPGVTRDNVVCKTKSHLQASKTLRVAFLVREDMFVNPGGDTTAISSYLRELKELGVTAEAHTETPKNLDSYDLAHLCNMCLPEQLEKYS